MPAELAYSAASPLGDAVVILGVAGIVIPLFARFRITPVIGFILAGLAVGPYGLGKLVAGNPWLASLTISDPHGLDLFAEIGIVLLLFSIGLELSFSRLWAMRRQVFGLGSLELLLGAALIALALIALGNSPSTAVALGLALAMSSTALVLRITDPGTAVGKAALAMLLFEDIALVPIIFLLGAMGRGGEAQDASQILHTLWQGGLVILALMLVGRWLLPHLFVQAARTKSPEVFLATSLLVVIVAALATSTTGLSPIVGALIAGLLIAETEYHGEVEAITAPFKGLALGIFLITVGMSIDLTMVWARLAEIAIALVAVFVVKAIVTGFVLRAMGARSGTATEAGILLASPSETTLIVLATALGVGLINAESAQFWQTVTALGLTITPLLALLGRRLARRVDVPDAAYHPEADPAARHAIVVGLGRVGRLVADMLDEHDKPYVAVDSDADLVIDGKRDGYNSLFADVSQGDALGRLGADHASAVILTMDQPVIVRRLVRKLRQQYPELPIIARARDASHAGELYRAGASHAVPETLEASLQLSEAVLVELGVAMGPLIASIHEKRDQLREVIMQEGELDEKPKLKSSSLRDRPQA